MNKEILRYLLENLASRAEQERTWTGLTPGVMMSFEEAIAEVFSYGYLGAEIDSGKSERYGDIVYKKMEQLSKLACDFPQDLGPWDQINHPMMDEIRAVAQDLLDCSLFTDDAESNQH